MALQYGVAGGDTLANLNGLLKEVYAEMWADLVPNFAVLTKETSFSKESLLGNKYHKMVVLGGEGGATYAKSDDGNITLNSASAMATKDAQIDGSQFYMLGQIDALTVSRAASAGKAAFANAMELLAKQLILAVGRRLEISLMYGQSGLGVAASSANVDATHTAITIQTSEWAGGIWSESLNSSFDIFNANTIQNTVAPLVLTKADLTNRILTVSGNSADIAAIDTAIAANPNVLKLFFQSSKITGGATYRDMVGLHAISSNAGTLFNVDGSTYPLWAGNVFSAGSQAFSQAKLNRAIALAVSKGLMEDVLVVVNPSTWTDLNTDAAAKRVFDSSYSSSSESQGTQELVYFSQNGKCRVVPHPLCKEGYAYILPTSHFKRIGSRDVGPGMPGLEDSSIIRVPGTNYYEVCMMYDQALFCDSPGRIVQVSGIVNGN